MRDFLIKLFRETEVVLEIKLFSIWHFMYIFLIVGLTIGLVFLLKNKSENAKDFTLKLLAYLIPAIYIADFFIMPLSREAGEIDLDKLPFHICTLMGCFVPFAQFNKKFNPIKHVIVVLSLVASLMYITYPGSALGGISTFSYKVVQTFVFHGLLFSWGFLNLAWGRVKLTWKTIWMELVALCIIALWAAFGNATFSSEQHSFDWFFITGSTFPFVPTPLMPFTVIAAIFGMCAIIYGIYFGTIKVMEKIALKRGVVVVTEVEKSEQNTTTEEK